MAVSTIASRKYIVLRKMSKLLMNGFSQIKFHKAKLFVCLYDKLEFHLSL